MILEIIVAIGTGIFSSLIASLVWLCFFNRLRPDVDISSQIAKSTDSKGKTVYKFKVINRGRKPLVELRAELFLVTPSIAPSGQVLIKREVRLAKNELLALTGFDSRDQAAGYAHRFLTYDDLETTWENDRAQYVSFRIYARHSLSGLGKYFEQKYFVQRNSVVTGDFSFGNSFDIR